MDDAPKDLKKIKIVMFATSACAYPAADAVGKAHHDYSTNLYVIRVPSPVMFSEEFYLNCFAKGIDGIIIAACGEECPYAGAFEQLSKRIDALKKFMKENQLEFQRLKLTAICTVCIKSFLKEISDMEKAVEKFGNVNKELASTLISKLKDQNHE